MSKTIQRALGSLFEKHRIVFWYDNNSELRDSFNVLELPNVEKIILENNEFGVKHRIIREQTDAKFLIYSENPQPAYLDNWLLDILLASGEFSTDQIALWRNELELEIGFSDLMKEHLDFFKAETRLKKLKALLSKQDTESAIRLKMLAVCCSDEPRIDTILESLLEELAKGKETKLKLIKRCHLENFLWKQLKRNYDYHSDSLGLEDFAIELFKSCYAMGVDGKVSLNNDALVFLKRWKDSRRHAASFEILSEQYAADLGIEKDLQQRDFRHLLEVDYFRLIDQKIIKALIDAVENRTVSAGDVSLWIKQRRQSHWYDEFKSLYAAIDKASQFFATLELLDFNIPSFDSGVMNYTQSWYKVDQIYRQFVLALQVSGKTSLFKSLADKIENHYSNNYLLKLNNLWQGHVDHCDKWLATSVMHQNQFFEHKVQPFLNKKKKVYVIISDAMRYEVADELLSRIRQEDRYNANLEPALSMLPSYTQLGMAALLPNKSLTIKDDNSATVTVDGVSSQGTANRNKILNNNVNGGATALKDKKFMALGREEGRSLFRENQLIYIYHNRIDHTGDKIQSEGEAFKAADETIVELLALIKRLTALNASNILVTADHGFIYQNRVLDESEFIDSAAKGEEVFYRDRRFVLGKGMKEHSGLKHFSSKQVGLDGDIEIQIPKSINRLRVKGSGSRFVHGGAALQEVVLPVISINKKRSSDISAVQVAILPGGTTLITSGQVAVTLYQNEPVTDKVKARRLRAGIYSQDNVLISDEHDLLFDMTSENPRERELKLRLVLSREADNYNNQEVTLKLKEKISNTGHDKEYQSLTYQMRRSFTTDFDF